MFYFTLFNTYTHIYLVDCKNMNSWGILLQLKTIYLILAGIFQSS